MTSTCAFQDEATPELIEGRIAALNGTPRNANPWRRGTDAAMDWDIGWDEAADRMEQMEEASDV